jgi:hypothetical protein
MLGVSPAIRNSRLVEQFDAKPAEIKAMFSNSLEPARVAEFRENAVCRPAHLKAVICS